MVARILAIMAYVIAAPEIIRGFYSGQKLSPPPLVFLQILLTKVMGLVGNFQANFETWLDIG